MRNEKIIFIVLAIHKMTERTIAASPNAETSQQQRSNSSTDTSTRVKEDERKLSDRCCIDLVSIAYGIIGQSSSCRRS